MGTTATSTTTTIEKGRGSGPFQRRVDGQPTGRVARVSQKDWMEFRSRE